MTRILNMAEDELRRAAAKSGPKSPLRDLVAQLDTLTTTRTPRARRRQREHLAQVALFDWQHEYHPELDRAMFGVPNYFGGGQSRFTLSWGVKLKAEGRKKGVSDIIVLVPRGPFHALCVELKVPPNDVDDEQRAWINDARDNDYCALVVYVTDTDIRNATSAIDSYLALGDPFMGWHSSRTKAGHAAHVIAAGSLFDADVRDAVATERRQKRDVAKKVSKKKTHASR